MKKIIVLIIALFVVNIAFAQNLSTGIAKGAINDIITVANQSGYNGVYFADDVKIFPNPVKSDLNFRINNAIAEDLNIFVYNTSGELSQSMKINKENSPLEYTVSINDLKPGIYFLEIKLGEYRAIKKINKL